MGGGTLRYIVLFTFILTFATFAQESPENPEAGTSDLPSDQESASPVDPGATYQVEEESLLFDAEAPDENNTNLPEQNLFNLGSLLRALLVLVLFAIGIYLFLLLIKRTQNKHKDSEIIHLLATHTLQSNRSLHLVEVSKRVFFLSSCEQSISLIAEITEKEELDELRIRTQQEPKKRSNRFFELLFPNRNKDATGEGGGKGLSVLRASIERLERLR